ncbi:[alpha-L-fucopyranosyl-(1-_3)-alpha-L-rhamnopyranosyl-(1-_3)-2-O-methyl-alpha-L-rhamnopyranosyl] dimycocerosyl phenol-phthiocerol 2'''-O-methyltransferase [soil metagenome]
MASRLVTLARKVAERVRPPKRRSWLESFRFRTVLDVGANTGQFAAEARAFAPDAMIHSFEPLPDCYDDLVKNFRGDRRFRARNLAVGDARGSATFRRSSYSPSSSMLEMAKLHRDAFPETAGGSEVSVNVDTLDDLEPELDLRAPVLLKIDVQGYEAHVLRGATHLLQKVDVAVVEMSIEPLYEGQTLFDGVYRMMVERGFLYRGNLVQLEHPADGRILQVDGLFTRA